MLLKLISENLLAPATTNLSDLSNPTLEMIKSNLYYYRVLTIEYLSGLTGSVNLYLWPVLCVLLAIGMLRECLPWRQLPLIAYLAGTYLVLILLPYTQGLRYMYPALPLLIMFIAHGGEWLFDKLRPAVRKHAGRVLMAVGLVMLIFAYLPAVENGVSNLQDGAPADGNAYSQEAVDMYRFIQENVPQEATIAFVKPRALYLNTGRMAIKPNVNGHQLEDADYFLHTPVLDKEEPFKPNEQQQALLTPVYQNRLFTLYEVAD